MVSTGWPGPAVTRSTAVRTAGVRSPRSAGATGPGRLRGQARRLADRLRHPRRGGPDRDHSPAPGPCRARGGTRHAHAALPPATDRGPDQRRHRHRLRRAVLRIATRTDDRNDGDTHPRRQCRFRRSDRLSAGVRPRRLRIPDGRGADRPLGDRHAVPPVGPAEADLARQVARTVVLAT